jgi:hypothetical protein
MRRIHIRHLLLPIAVLVARVAIAQPPLAARTADPLEQFVGKAPSVSDPTAPAGPVVIMIDHWSSDAECRTLADGLQQRGAAALLPELQKMWRPAGIVLVPVVHVAGAHVPSPPPRPLRFAAEHNTPGGRQLILAADTSLAFGEPARTWPSNDAFTLIDIRFGPERKGVGKIAGPTQVAYNSATKLLEITNYPALPVRLTDVRATKP